jgi:lipopolysaccharide transport system ATP-binding protein
MMSKTTNNTLPNYSHSDGEVLIKVEGVSKKFCRDLKKSLWYGVKDMVAELLPFGSRQSSKKSYLLSGSNGDSLANNLTNGSRSSALRPGEFWAVNDVSFEVKRGECLGLIGRNGAGKTTLLKMLNGLIKPDKGRIEMRGRVGALISLGAGFNPILTGRENVYVNGSVLGLKKKEIDEKIDEIIDFAEIREFIDSPVQSYSSGMHVRLGFAVATAMNPDVLLLDEVLAVGDAGFRHKCYSRISKLLRSCAVIFVSHSMEQVAQICHGILRMRQGVGTWHPDILEGISAYNKDNQSTGNGEAASVRAVYPPVQHADFTIDQCAVQHGDTLDVCLRVWLERPIRGALLSFVVRNESELPIVCWNSSQFDTEFDFPAGASELRFPVGPLHLHPGKYNCSIFMTEPKSIEHCIWYWNQQRFVMEGHRRQLGGIPVLAPYQGHSLKPISLDSLASEMEH